MTHERDLEDSEVAQGLVDYYPLLLRCAVRLTGDPDAAADLVQDTGERAYRKRGLFEPGTNVRAWLLSVQQNLYFTQRRRAQGMPEAAEIEAEDTKGKVKQPSAEAAAIDGIHTRDIARQVRNGISQLPPHYRQIIETVDIKGLNYEQTAAALVLPHGTVASRLARGRKKLAETLEPLRDRHRE